jgi:hypothetical protein
MKKKNYVKARTTVYGSNHVVVNVDCSGERLTCVRGF